MSDWYEFGGYQFESVDSDWALEERSLALDQTEVLGHTLYRTYKNLLLARYENWWAISFEERYKVQPVFTQILGYVRTLERTNKSMVDPEQFFGLTKKERKRVMKTLAWVQQMDYELFPPDGGVDAGIPDFRQIRVFHAPVCHSSFYILAPHGIYRVIETYAERFTELYPLTDERVDYIESLIPGRSSDHTPLTEWSMVADFVV